MKATDGGWVEVTASFAPALVSHPQDALTPWGQVTQTGKPTAFASWAVGLKSSHTNLGPIVDSPHHTVLTSRAQGRLPLAPSGREGGQWGAPRADLRGKVMGAFPCGIGIHRARRIFYVELKCDEGSEKLSPQRFGSLCFGF